MIQIQGSIPRKITIACSGGVDSMAITDFLKRSHIVTLQFVHHLTETSEKAYHFLREYANKNNIDLNVDFIDPVIPKNTSQEEHWRNQRYSIFYNLSTPIITAHHLDDCVETWIWSSLNGEGKVIPYSNMNVIRPFRLNKKSEFYNWCNRHNVPYIEDESNNDTKYMRNYIRHTMMPHILKVNPGIHKVIYKKIFSENVNTPIME
jgi:tRNA(Ile)-lysidine synthase